MARFSTIFLILSALATTAFAGIGNPEITYEMAYEGPETLCLMVRPDGGGPALTDTRLPGGSLVDATITAEVLDLNYQPIPNFPAEDMWLISADEGMAPCTAGSIADGPTDAQGLATFSGPLMAGGWSTQPTQLVVNGWVVTSSAGLNLIVNSPDINGDLEVNITDVQIFASDYFGGIYRHRSDLTYDQQINLADIVPLANAMGAGCP